MLFLRPDAWRLTHRGISARDEDINQFYREVAVRPDLNSTVALGINCTAAIEHPLGYAASYSAWLDANPRYYDEPVPSNISSGAIPPPMDAWPGPMSVVLSKIDNWWFTGLRRPLVLQGLRELVFYGTGGTDNGGALGTYETTSVWQAERLPVVTREHRAPDVDAARGPFLAFFWCTVIIAVLAVVNSVATAIVGWMEMREQCISFPNESKVVSPRLTRNLFFQLRERYPSIAVKYNKPATPPPPPTLEDSEAMRASRSSSDPYA